MYKNYSVSLLAPVAVDIVGPVSASGIMEAVQIGLHSFGYHAAARAAGQFNDDGTDDNVIFSGPAGVTVSARLI